jgi:peroxiredoxin
MKKVQVGDQTPDFTRTAPTGEQVCLSDLTNQKMVELTR